MSELRELRSSLHARVDRPTARDAGSAPSITPIRPRLTVAILTFRRPEQLRTNLGAVSRRVADARDRVDARILVVDNDPDASARDIVTAASAAARALHSGAIDYVHEPRPGIPAARNRALDESSASQLLAFIDDDVIPQAGWLTSLIDVWRQTGADAVMGRVIFELPPGIEPWVASSSFFHRGSHPTGTVLRAAATGNLLLDLRSIRGLDLRFDETLGLGGGEDTVFTSLLTRRGGTIVWCQESATIDPVVTDRATRAWVRKRAYAHGNAIVQIRMRIAPTPAKRWLARYGELVGGPARVAVGSARHLWGTLARDPVRQQRAVSQIHRGLGVLHGAFGHHYQEYARQGQQP